MPTVPPRRTLWSHAGVARWRQLSNCGLVHYLTGPIGIHIQLVWLKVAGGAYVSLPHGRPAQVPGSKRPSTQELVDEAQTISDRLHGGGGWRHRRPACRFWCAPRSLVRRRASRQVARRSTPRVPARRRSRLIGSRGPAPRSRMGAQFRRRRGSEPVSRDQRLRHGPDRHRLRQAEHRSWQPGGFAGGGFLRIAIPTGGTTNGQWSRPMSAIRAGQPGANGGAGQWQDGDDSAAGGAVRSTRGTRRSPRLHTTGAAGTTRTLRSNRVPLLAAGGQHRDLRWELVLPAVPCTYIQFTLAPGNPAGKLLFIDVVDQESDMQELVFRSVNNPDSGFTGLPGAGAPIRC